MLQINSADDTNRKFEIKVPSRLTSDQLALVISGGLNGSTHGCVVGDSEIACEIADLAAVSPIIAADPEHGVVQPQCVHQWHPDVCGHHAIFSCKNMLRQLSGGDGASSANELLDEQLFWHSVLSNIQRLAHVGEKAGRWPRSRVTCGVLDSIHMVEIIETDEFLRDRLNVMDHPDQLAADTPAGKALADVAAGRRKAHGFLLGCAVHWMGAVVTNSVSGPRVWLFDSFNRSLGRLRTPEEIKQLAEKYVSEDGFREKLTSASDWQHKPAEAIEAAVEEGVPEWWKGIKKASLFWRFKPRSLRQELQVQELDYLQKYLQTISSAWLHAKPPLA